MNAKHTPGPWTASVYSSVVGSLICGDNVNVAAVFPIAIEINDSQSIANARLIAAAPELLAVAQLGYELSTWAACINWRGGENQKEWLDDLRQKIEEFQPLASAAITNATGGGE